MVKKSARIGNVMKTLSKRFIGDKQYYVRQVEKLWIGRTVSIKDYEWDEVKRSGLPLIIVLTKEDAKMTLSPEEVKKGRYSTGTYKELFEPYKKGFLINFDWIEDPKLVQENMFDAPSVINSLYNVPLEHLEAMKAVLKK